MTRVCEQGERRGYVVVLRSPSDYAMRFGGQNGVQRWVPGKVILTRWRFGLLLISIVWGGGFGNPDMGSSYPCRRQELEADR